MKNRILSGPVTLFLAVAFFLASVDRALLAGPAQPQMSPPRESYAHTGMYFLEIANGQLVFPVRASLTGATLGNVVDVLRDRYTNANFVLSSGLDNLMVSDLKLRAGSPAQDLDAIRAACDNKFEWQLSAHHSSAPAAGAKLWDAKTGQAMAFSEDGKKLEVQSGQPTDTVSLFVLHPSAQPPEAGKVVEVFNLAPYFERMNNSNASGKRADDMQRQLVGDLTDIINETIDAVRTGVPGKDRHPTFSFHPGASLLVVVGAEEDLDVTRKVINAVVNPTDIVGPASANAWFKRGPVGRRLPADPSLAPDGAHPPTPDAAAPEAPEPAQPL